MAKFLIEVPHEAEERACALAIEILFRTGSHWVTNAEWGCMDGEHKGWVIVDVDTKEEARGILPPIYRSSAKIGFRIQDMEQGRGCQGKPDFP